MATTAKITPTVVALLNGRLLPDPRIYSSFTTGKEYALALSGCSRVLRAYKRAQNQPLNDKQRATLQRRLLRTGGSIQILTERLDGPGTEPLLTRATQLRQVVLDCLGISVQHLQAEVEEIRAMR